MTSDHGVVLRVVHHVVDRLGRSDVVVRRVQAATGAVRRSAKRSRRSAESATSFRTLVSPRR
jgi:hypothetical protein